MDRAQFYDIVRKGSSNLFGGSLSQPQVDGMEGILNAFVKFGDGHTKTLAYALATAYHETGTRMVPVREGFASTDAQARAIVAHRRYGKPGTTGLVYYGRGHVQLTWEKNYRNTGKKLNIDLASNPDMILDPELSARVLIEGLIDGRWNGKGKGIAHYLPENGPDDLKNARRTVNVLDKWSLIGGYYKAFLSAIKTAGGVPKTMVEAVPVASTEEAVVDVAVIASAETVTAPSVAAEDKQVSVPLDAPVVKRASAPSDASAGKQEPASSETPTGKQADVSAILVALLEVLSKKQMAGSAEQESEASVLLRLLQRLSGDETKPDDALTPVNAWLGDTIGNALNGKKTGVGLIGLVATSLLPVLFPETGSGILQALDLGAADGAESAAKGSSLLNTIFGALSGWGVLGKLEKWVNVLAKGIKR